MIETAVTDMEDMVAIAMMEKADMAAIASLIAATGMMTAAARMIDMTTGEATAVEAGGRTSSATACAHTLLFSTVFGRNMSAEAGRRCANPKGALGCRKRRLIA
jgi:hypothetical protein